MIICEGYKRERKLRRYSYSAYSKTKVVKLDGSDKMIKNPYGYTAREWEEEMGDYYYRARYYDPKTGRFLSEDPIGFRGKDMNLYRYVRNNPLIFKDPKGEAVNFLGPVVVGGIVGGLLWYFIPDPKPAPYDPDKFPKVQPPYPYPDNTDDLEERLRKKRENKKFKDSCA